MDFNDLLGTLQDSTEVFTVQDIVLTIVLSFVLSLVVGLVYQRYAQRCILLPVLRANPGIAGHGGWDRDADCRFEHRSRVSPWLGRFLLYAFATLSKRLGTLDLSSLPWQSAWRVVLGFICWPWYQRW